MEKFIKFLEENNARKAFERAFKKFNQDVECYKKEVKRDKKLALLQAFDWTDSKEGFAYWNELDKKWIEANRPLNEKLLSDD